MPAAFVDYYFSGAQIKNAGRRESSRSNYLNLRSGLNLGAWRLRNISSMQYDQQRRHWDTQSTWLQRDVRSLKSLLRIGDTYTTGDVFDSIQFRGVQLMSDDEMLPGQPARLCPHHSWRGAQQCQSDRLSARVCDLRDLCVAGGVRHQRSLPHLAERRSEVKVTESNGAVRTFTQPHSAVPYMLREGRGKFSLSAGRYHSGGVGALAGILQGTLFYGLTAGFTLYGGTQLARDYQAWALGLGRGFGEFGSLGGMSPRPSPVRRRASAIRAISGCALSIRKILSARALRSASPAIATRQAAITILPEASALESAQGQ